MFFGVSLSGQAFTTRFFYLLTFHFALQCAFVKNYLFNSTNTPCKIKKELKQTVQSLTQLAKLIKIIVSNTIPNHFYNNIKTKRPKTIVILK